MKKSIGALAIASLLSLPIATACDRQPDIQGEVEKSLAAAKLDHVDVEWDNDAKVAHLKGQVNSPDERQRAEEVASAAVGTSGTVLNELTVEGLNEDTADNMDGQIRDRLSEMIQNDPALKDRNINVDVNNGAVSVSGTVASEAEKQKVTQLLKSVPGVKDFANGLEIEATR